LLYFCSFLWCFPFLHIFSFLFVSTFTPLSPIATSHIISLFYLLLLWSVHFLSLVSWFFFPQVLVATSLSSNLIGSFTSARTNHRPHRPLYNNLCTCWSVPLTVKPIDCPGTHNTYCVTFQKSENLVQSSYIQLTTIKISITIQFDKLFC
jgi:hypothetical protein